ncbi:MAG: hypothetical protein NXI31_13575 [bacterium]|nr:hypothetical protein [bacterium]
MNPTNSRTAALCAALLSIPLLATPLMAQWSPIQPPNQPSGRSDALMAYDLANNRMLMFGGNWSNDFFALENGAWTSVTPNTLPSPRRWAAMSVDPLVGEIVLYGGDGGNRYALDETWIWNGTDWSQAATLQSPGGLGRHGMAFDTTRQVTVLFGGRNDSWFPLTQSDATWEFSSGNWTQVFPSTRPPSRIAPAMSHHPVTGAVIMFGGQDLQGLGLDDTWTFDGTDWTRINTTGPRPTPRMNARMVPVLNRNLCLLFGGEDPVTNQILNDTWEHDGTNWVQVQTFDRLLPARHSMAIAHDIVRDRIVAFGGKTSNSALRNDTWEYGAHWLKFGSACVGSAGRPTFDGGTVPSFGQTCDATLSNLPPASALAFVVVGFSKTQWQFGTLPAFLDPFGMPGCRAQTSGETMTAISASSGTAQFTWNVPNSSIWFGQQFHLQGLVLDPGVNAAGATTSNGLTLLIGI